MSEDDHDAQFSQENGVFTELPPTYWVDRGGEDGVHDSTSFLAVRSLHRTHAVGAWKAKQS